MIGQPVPHERHRRPSQRAYGDLRGRILSTLTRPRQNRTLSGLLHIARLGFLIVDMPVRWMMDLFDGVSGNRGYLAVGSVLAAYLAVFGLSTQSLRRRKRELALNEACSSRLSAPIMPPPLWLP